MDKFIGDGKGRKGFLCFISFFAQVLIFTNSKSLICPAHGMRPKILTLLFGIFMSMQVYLDKKSSWHKNIFLYFLSYVYISVNNQRVVVLTSGINNLVGFGYFLLIYIALINYDGCQTHKFAPTSLKIRHLNMDVEILIEFFSD